MKKYDDPETIQGKIYGELVCIADNCIIGKDDMKIFNLCADQIMHLVNIALDGYDNEFKNNNRRMQGS